MNDVILRTLKNGHNLTAKTVEFVFHLWLESDYYIMAVSTDV